MNTHKSFTSSNVSTLLAIVAILSLFCAKVYGQTNAKAFQKGSINAIRVTISPQGIDLSQTKARSGTITFLIENRSGLKAPDLIISGLKVQNQKEDKEAKAKLDVKQPTRRAIHELVLSPGTWLVSLAGAPQVQTRLIVE